MSLVLSASITRDDGSDISLSLDEKLEERIIQEELWSQTSWPEGEPTLAELIRQHEEPDPAERIKRIRSEIAEIMGAVDVPGEAEAAAVDALASSLRHLLVAEMAFDLIKLR